MGWIILTFACMSSFFSADYFQTMKKNGQQKSLLRMAFFDVKWLKKALTAAHHDILTGWNQSEPASQNRGSRKGH